MGRQQSFESIGVETAVQLVSRRDRIEAIAWVKVIVSHHLHHRMTCILTVSSGHSLPAVIPSGFNSQ
jgi:hypothetical protein